MSARCCSRRARSVLRARWGSAAGLVRRRQGVGAALYPAAEPTITFDTTVDPVRYVGYIWTHGPEFTRSARCEDSEGSIETMRANATWLDTRDEAGMVSADRTTITGVFRAEGANGSFYVESQYTITRLD